MTYQKFGSDERYTVKMTVSKVKKLVMFLFVSGALVACSGKPSEVSEEFWNKYKDLGAPKILYQCGNEIGYSAGIGMGATYNKLVSDAKDSCLWEKFKILHSQQ